MPDRPAHQKCAMIRRMSKKAKRKLKAIEAPIEPALEAEAAYYARKCGITIQEAAQIIREAHKPTLSIVRKDGAKGH